MTAAGDLAALAFAGLTSVVVAFQVGLALGAPWGALAMGGSRIGRLPPQLRVAAVVQAAVLGSLALIVLAVRGIAGLQLASEASWTVWLPVGVSAVATVLNAVTPSRAERRLWLPVAGAMLLMSILVAVAR